MNVCDLPYKVLDLALCESAARTPGQVAERRDAIAQNPCPLRRAGALLVHHAAGIAGRERLFTGLSQPYVRKGYDVVGYGHTASTLKHGDEVIKIVRNSARIGPEGRAALIAEIKRHIFPNTLFHPDITTPTEISIERSPLLGHDAVVMRQPYVPMADYSDSKELREAIKDFSERSLDEMGPLGYLPDVVGINNVYPISHDRFALVDTVAIGRETNPLVFGRCSKLLRAMAASKRLPQQ